MPIPAARPYSYTVPPGMELAPGDYVQVPLGPRKVAAIVLGAGRSSRMGQRNKLLAPVGGEPMLLRVVDAALKAVPVDLVVGRILGRNRINDETTMDPIPPTTTRPPRYGHYSRYSC